MPGGKKKSKSSSKKKNKSSRNKDGGAKTTTDNRKKAIPLDEVLLQAEQAMEMSNVDAALQLFTYASGILRPRVHNNNNNTSATDGNSMQQDNDNDTNEQDKKILSTILGKMGEIKASNGNVDGARSDFLDAVELLGPSTYNNNNNNNNSNNDMTTEVGECSSNVETAQTCESRASLHLYLGQLSCGNEALTSLNVGVQELQYAVFILERIIESSANAKSDEDDVDMDDGDDDDMMSIGNLRRFLIETRRQLCAAHCSIAELYLTDLCEEPDAESLCEAALKSALAIESTGPDALQTMANFRLSQSRLSEGLECILKAYERMKEGCEAMSALVGLGSSNNKAGIDTSVELDETRARELVNVEAASSLPEYNFRCQTVKIMLECASLLENGENSSNVESAAKNKDEMINTCAESAIQVLGSLIAENDEVIEVWYLLGCAFMACKPSNEDSAKYYWNHALEMLQKVKESLEEVIDCGGDDEDEAENELEMIMCQIQDIEKKLGGAQGDEKMDDT